MHNKNTGLAVASVLFGITALIHGLRLVTHFSVAINGQDLPLFVSAINLVGAGFLSIWLWTLRRAA